ncbi:MAG: ferrous iron transporter B, partial [Akkermansia sp.]|nr:ferrous iron transporter B [Akkermansia sp.]
ERCKAFVQKAGTVIFVSSALIWFLSSYNWKVDSVEQNDSMLASIGNVAAPVFQPLGWGEWKPTMATITGLIAKENVVGTFGVLYADGSSGEEAEEEPAETQEMSPAGQELQASLEGASEEAAAEEAAAEEEEDEDAEIRETGDRLVQAGAFTFLSAFSFMIFNLLCAPCFAAMGAIRREMNSAKWTFFAIGYMCALAYCLAFLIYQMGAWLYAEASFGIGQGLAVLLLLGLIYLVVKKPSASSK